MFQIQNLTSDSRQKQTLVLPDSTSIVLELFFIPMQFGWFISSLTYGDFVLTGVRIVNSPNMLYQFRNQIPFGLKCVTQGDREPSQLEDLSSGAVKLYILTRAEVEQYVEYLSG